MNLTLPEPSDADLQRAWDLLQANGRASPVQFARTVLRRWGVVVTWQPTPTEPEPMPEQSTTTSPFDPVEQQARQDRLEQAYADSGRTNGIYTGLLAEPQGQPVQPAEETA